LLLTCYSPWPSSLFFRAPSTSQIYTLSLHDALPISRFLQGIVGGGLPPPRLSVNLLAEGLGGKDSVKGNRQGSLSRWIKQLFETDRKSTRLNSSHVSISYAVFCLKKKKTFTNTRQTR